MSYDKGTIHLVEAVRALWLAGRDLELVLAGAPLAEFERYLRQLPPDVRRRLHNLGPVSEADKLDLLAAADVVAVPSRTDSFGIVYLEAWLYEKPVIGARTWGVGDVICDGQDGLQVSFGDVDGLSRAIWRLIDDPALREAMGSRGRSKALDCHTWERKYRLTLEVYADLVRQGTLRL
jgi:glycosyltransferase involved in cell wall biosynthesis